MDTPNPILNFFSELNISTISNYLEKITDLYLKPVSVWKKILSDQKISMNVFIFYILIYCLIIYIFTPNFLFISKLILIQLALNIQPFVILSIPFIIFTKVWKIKIKLNRLFRITFILCLQIFPIIYIPIAISEKYGIESPYILSDNATVLLDILLICIVPMMTKVSLLKKAIWVISNYIFLNLFITLSIYTYGWFPDIDLLRSKIQSNAPKDEFNNFEARYKDSDLYLSDQYYILFYKPTNYKFYKTQYATYYLLDTIAENNIRMLNRSRFKLDNLIYKGDSSKAYIKKIQRKDKTNFDVTISVPLEKDDFISSKMLNTYRNKFNKKIDSDLKLTDSLKTFAKFKENRELFKQFHNLLSTYEQIYTDTIFIKKIVEGLKKEDFNDLYVDDGSKLVLINIGSQKNNRPLLKIKRSLGKQYNKILSRFEMSTILHDYFYFIPHLIFTEKKKPLKEEFKNIHFLN